MGVSVRLSRNTRVSLPFWLAVPVGIAAAVVWAVVVLAAGLVDGIWWLVRAARARRAA
jgi:hypothetical protein